MSLVNLLSAVATTGRSAVLDCGQPCSNFTFQILSITTGIGILGRVADSVDIDIEQSLDNVSFFVTDSMTVTGAGGLQTKSVHVAQYMRVNVVNIHNALLPAITIHSLPLL